MGGLDPVSPTLPDPARRGRGSKGQEELCPSQAEVQTKDQKGTEDQLKISVKVYYFLHCIHQSRISVTLLRYCYSVTLAQKNIVYLPQINSVPVYTVLLCATVTMSRSCYHVTG